MPSKPIQPEDPRLSAFLLGELPSDEAAAIERAVAADPALALSLKELESVQRLLSNTFAPETACLHPRQREAILRAARHADEGGKIIPLPSQRSSRKSILIPLAAAAMITLAVFLVLRLPAGPPPTAQKPSLPNEPPAILPLEVALLPAPGPADNGSSPSDARPTAASGLEKSAATQSAALIENSELFLRTVAERLAASPVPDEKVLPPLQPRAPVYAADHPMLPLPVHVGRASLGWISHSVRNAHQRPPAAAVRLEEMLNHFALRPAGATAFAQGVTLSTEIISCPWKPSSSLLLVSFRGHKDAARDLKANFCANPSAIRRYRLLGFSPVVGISAGPLPARLPAQSVTTLVVEVEPTGTSNQFGSIEWLVSGKASPSLVLSRQAESEPSDDARFAALVCTYALWLTGEAAGLIDTELVAALARECAAEGIGADRVDFLTLVEQSLNL
jgi:negative regulator of sigma E activity